MAVYFFTYPHFINVKWERLIDHQWTPINRRLHSEDSAVVRFRSKEKDISLCGNLTTLVIPVVQEEDAGVYRVTVANEVGQKSLNITVSKYKQDLNNYFSLLFHCLYLQPFSDLSLLALSTAQWPMDQATVDGITKLITHLSYHGIPEVTSATSKVMTKVFLLTRPFHCDNIQT